MPYLVHGDGLQINGRG
uniref:Uncharacterized protein n=1 Tax=Rhizophora mucronata TaxID=61149 RepID=A0A2P2QGW0_RHIMU